MFAGLLGPIGMLRLVCPPPRPNRRRFPRRRVGEIMADAASKYPTDTKEHRASRATARANKPRPRPTKCAARSLQPDSLADGVPILLGLMHLVFEGHDVRNIPAVVHADSTNLLTVAAPCFDPCGHLSRCNSEVPAPRECLHVERKELVRRCPR